MADLNPDTIFNIPDYTRQFKIESAGDVPSKVIKATDGKEIPDVLKGFFTNDGEANKAIDRFLFIQKEDAINLAKFRKRKKLTKLRQTYEEENKVDGSPKSP